MSVLRFSCLQEADRSSLEENASTRMAGDEESYGRFITDERFGKGCDSEIETIGGIRSVFHGVALGFWTNSRDSLMGALSNSVRPLQFGR